MEDTFTDDDASGGDRAESTRTAPAYSPATDIYESQDALILLLEMPGVDPDAINVTLDKRVLTIAGRCRRTALSGYSLSHAEYREGDYERAFTLSEAIASDSIEASVRDGVLRLVLPKSRPQPAKTISVKSA